MKSEDDNAFVSSGPAREKILPYGHQWVDEDDIAAVTAVLRSDWLTTGPTVGQFEQAFAACTGAAEAVAVSSGTAALHAAMFALGIAPGDEVIVPAMTFAASANCVVYQGGTPVFADVDADTLLIDPDQVEARITPRTRAVISVDYAGQPCDYERLRAICQKHGLSLVADACHSLGGSYKGQKVGTIAELSTFSLHPVKHITTGEGGVITTNDAGMAQRLRTFRNHGITTDARQREEHGLWFYEMVQLGYNYRLTDFQAALGISQLRKLPCWLERRREIADAYDRSFASNSLVAPLGKLPQALHAYHLYVVRLNLGSLGLTRGDVYAAMRQRGIGVQVHYIPVHLHPFYRNKYGTGPGLCPVAETAYEQILTLPLFPQMTDVDIQDVITALDRVLTCGRSSVSSNGG